MVTSLTFLLRGTENVGALFQPTRRSAIDSCILFPYQIAESVPAMVLVEAPFFRQWSGMLQKELQNIGEGLPALTSWGSNGGFTYVIDGANRARGEGSCQIKSVTNTKKRQDTLTIKRRNKECYHSVL